MLAVYKRLRRVLQHHPAQPTRRCCFDVLLVVVVVRIVFLSASLQNRSRSFPSPPSKPRQHRVGAFPVVVMPVVVMVSVVRIAVVLLASRCGGLLRSVAVSVLAVVDLVVLLPVLPVHEGHTQTRRGGRGRSSKVSDGFTVLFWAQSFHLIGRGTAQHTQYAATAVFVLRVGGGHEFHGRGRGGAEREA